MMMLYFKQYLGNKNFNDVLQFVVFNLEAYCLYEGEIKSIDEHGEVLFSFEFNSKAIHPIGEELIFSGKNFYLKEDEIKYIDVLSGKYFTGIFHNNILLFTGNEYTFYDIKNSKIIQTSKFNNTSSIYKLFKNGFICHGGKFTTFNDFSTGLEVWRHEFPVNIDKIETLGDDLILVALSGVHSKGLIYGISPKDGTVLWEVEGGYLHVFEDRIFVKVYREDAPYQLKEINPATGKETVYVLADILAKNGLDRKLYSDYQVVGNLIYISFFDHKTLVIINLEELKLEWIHKVETDAEYIRPLKVAGNRLYVLDEGNTLHIFEKE